MVLMRDIKGKEDAINIAKKLNQQLTRVIEDSQGKVTVTASIGITVCQGKGDYETLYKQADDALYNTKKNGRNGRTLYGE